MLPSNHALQTSSSWNFAGFPCFGGIYLPCSPLYSFDTTCPSSNSVERNLFQLYYEKLLANVILPPLPPSPSFDDWDKALESNLIYGDWLGVFLGPNIFDGFLFLGSPMLLNKKWQSITNENFCTLQAYLSSSDARFFLVWRIASGSDDLLKCCAPTLSGRLCCLTCFKGGGWKVPVTWTVAGLLGTDSTECNELFLSLCEKVGFDFMAFITSSKPDPDSAFGFACWEEFRIISMD